MTIGAEFCADDREILFMVGVVTKAALVVRGNCTGYCMCHELFMVCFEELTVTITQQGVAGSAQAFFSTQEAVIIR